MSARRLVVVCGTVVLAGWVAGGLARFGSSGIDDTEDSRATSVNVDAEPVDAPQVTTMDGHSHAHAAIGDAALPSPRPMLPPESQHVLVAAASTPDPLARPHEGSIELGQNSRRVLCVRNLRRPIPLVGVPTGA